MNYAQNGRGFELHGAQDEIIASGAITIENIAHGLSNICRFHGQLKTFFSVAQHSVLMAQNAPNNRLAILCMLHDAAEAYTGDVITPIKQAVKKHTPYIKNLEDKIDGAVQRVFLLEPPDHNEEKIIKFLDQRSFVTETRDLLPETVHVALSGLFIKAGVQCFGKTIQPLSPFQAKNNFLQTWDRLHA
jgi:5'-deoxynucleotidase YfbR-like HD superfamily hydrolase